MELKQKAINGVVWSGVQIWGGKLVSFLIIVVLSRLLPPEIFGLVAMATVYLAFVQIVQDQGFGVAIVQLPHLDDAHLDTAFWTNLLICLLLSIGSFAAAGLVGRVFQEPRLVSIIQWLSLSFIITGLSSTQQALLTRQFAFKQLALRTFISVMAGGIVGIAMAFFGFGVWSLIAQTLITGLVEAIVLWAVSGWTPGFRFSLIHFRELFLFGINIVGINFLKFLNRHSDDFLIGYFYGPTIVGYYTIAYRILVTMTDMLTSVTNAVALPAFSRLQSSSEQMRSAYYKVTQYTSVFSFPAFLGIAVLAPEIINVVFGPQWTPSIPVMRVLAFIGILHSILYFNNSVGIAAGKPSWRLGMSFANAISNVIAFMLVIRLGIVAVAVAYVVRGYLLFPLEVWTVYKLIRIDIKYYFTLFFGPVASSAVMALVMIFLKLVIGENINIYFRLIILIFSGGFSYFIAIKMFMPALQHHLVDLIRLAMPDWMTHKAI